MAGVYGGQRSSYFEYSSPEVLKSLLDKEKNNNKYLKDCLHSEKMHNKALKEDIKKIRHEKEKLMDNESILRITEQEKDEMREMIKNLENIIIRMQENKNPVNLREKIVEQEINLKNYENKIASLFKEYKDCKNRLSQIERFFEKAKSEKFTNQETLWNIEWFLNSNKDDKVKLEKIANLSADRNNLMIIDEVVLKSSSQNKSEIFASRGVKKPNDIEIQYENMHTLNKCIENYVESASLRKRLSICATAVNALNNSQSTAILYPYTADYVALSEVGNFSTNYKDSLYFANSEFGGPLVVQSHWKQVIGEFSEKAKQRNSPKVLLLIARERTEKGAKFVLFIVETEAKILLRYDPLEKSITDRAYLRVYGEIFTEYSDFNTWQNIHLAKENKSLSWIYCIEFARRFTMKAEEDGIDKLRRNIMHGKIDEYSGFSTIDFGN